MEKKVKKEPIKVLFASFEAEPFMKAGGLGDVAGTLPAYVKSPGFDIRVILPNLSVIPREYKDKMVLTEVFEVPLSWRRQYCGLMTMKYKGIQYYFLDNEYYFKRDRIYGEFDDGERAAFYAKAVLESIQHIPDFMPDILHTNDWHAALIPVYLHEQYRQIPGYDRIKTVFTVHNLKFQGMFSGFMLGDVLGLHDTPAADQIMMGDAVNFMQGALRYSDRLTTVSPTYAQEIRTPYYGEGLDWLFNERADRLTGILNGIDYKKYDPMTDKNIALPFNADDLENKRKDKEQLQADLGLEVNADIPLFVVVSRLTEQKGFDLVTQIMPQIAQRRMQLAVLGVGQPEYEECFRWYAGEYRDKVAACITFDEPLSHRLYACGDVLMMPSRFEPCGLSQMMAMRYGCLPLVRETGGLKDSVMPYNAITGEGTGFTFANYSAQELMDTVDRALTVWYENRQAWDRMVVTAMKSDFSWKASAKQYRQLYKELAG